MGRAANFRFLDAFWGKVDVRGPDECWEWRGARYHDNYGAFNVRRGDGSKTQMRAHALALTLAGAEDGAGRYALHHCDNPPCCNPRHLYWGDQRRNIADMDRRGRANRPILRGEQSPRAKLTEAAVRKIRTLYATGAISQQTLADLHGVDQTIISDVVRRVTWKHVP